MSPVTKTSSKTQLTKRTKRGVIVRLSSPQTAVVEVTELLSHPKYFKRYSRSKRFLAQVSTQSKVGAAPLQVGQAVTIIESRPYSKRKHWRVVV
ncbi:MAG: uS17 family ribosomal protein [Candidatus Andersenbacteria bacterium]